jgi:hypothetical protein
MGWKDGGGAGAQNLGNAGVRETENIVLDRRIVEVEVKKRIPEMGRTVVGRQLLVVRRVLVKLANVSPHPFAQLKGE